MLALCRALIRVGRAIVPAAYRDDWTREWQAELYYRAASLRDGASARCRLDLVARCVGAIVHAVWLRKEEWSLTMLRQDLRYAVRGLRTHPAFAIVSIAILSLGIGANTAVFSVVQGVLLEPLPYREPDRLVQIWETNPLRNWTHETVAPANLLDWRERSRSFEDIAYYLGTDGKRPYVDDATLSGSGEPERVRAMMVSGNFFEVLGVPARVGRTLMGDDALAGGPPSVVLSEAFWRRRFGGDPSVVGRRLDLNGVSTEVVGIMPRGFHLPGATVDFWEPHRMAVETQRRMRRAHWFRAVGRLKPGVSLDQARVELARIASDLEKQYPDTNTKMGVGLGPLHDWFVGDVRQAMTLLMAAVALVLLITCTNVASLLLARATARRREMAIRVALGAGRLRLLRQLFTESLILAVGAGVFGLALAGIALGVVRRTGPATLPRLQEVAIGAPVLLFVMGTVCATALLFGTVPAWRSSRVQNAESLKPSPPGVTGTSGFRRMLVVGEVALSVVLLAAAGLLVKSFARLQSVNPGIDTNAISFRISLPLRYDSDAKAAAFFSDATARLRSMPGVRAAGATVRLALEGRSWTGDLFIDGRPEVWGRELRHKSVTPGYLDAAGLRVLRGRDFNAQDTATSQPVVIVNATLAARFFGDANPVGLRIAFDRPVEGTTWLTIVGVASDEKQDALDAAVEPEVYAPHTQDTRDKMSIVVRSSRNLLDLLPMIRREIAALDPTVAVYDIRTLQQVVSMSLAEERFSTLLLIGFAVMALILAAVGLYGVIAFGVTARTREIGVRLALGASRADVVMMVVGTGIRMVGFGLAIGLAVALLCSRALQRFLFETTAADPVVLSAVAAALLGAGLSASYLPAARASRLDPATSLRAE